MATTPAVGAAGAATPTGSTYSTRFRPCSSKLPYTQISFFLSILSLSPCTCLKPVVSFKLHRLDTYRSFTVVLLLDGRGSGWKRKCRAIKKTPFSRIRKKERKKGGRGGENFPFLSPPPLVQEEWKKNHLSSRDGMDRSSST